MPSVQIKHVPEDVHAVLRRRAALAGQSLQEYLLAKLVKEAGAEPIEEIFARVERERSGVSIDIDEVVAIIRSDRDSR